MKTAETPLSVFLVDDDKMFLTTLKYDMSERFKSNIKVKAFTSGEECLENLGKEHPDVVVLDYYLDNEKYPGAMNGMEVLKKIRAINSDTKVIMLSAQDKLEVASESIRSGAYDYVTKSESAPVRLYSILKNAFQNTHDVMENKKYETRNYMMGTALLLMILFDIIYYVAK